MKLIPPKFTQLNPDQRKQIEMQWKKQQHKNHTITVSLSGHGDDLKKFIVHAGVWNPAYVTAVYHASYAYYNNARLYKGKKALDIGTGTGIMGVVMALGGAKSVLMSDISSKAVANAKANVKQFGIGTVASVVQGDLFENVKGTFDFIVFNLPYFADIPPAGDTIAASMLAPGELIQRFLKDAKKFLRKGGTIMMPYFDKAGPTNNPSIQAPKHGYKATTGFQQISDIGMQKGNISVVELTLK